MRVDEARVILAELHTDYHREGDKLEAIKKVAESGADKLPKCYLLDALKFLIARLEDDKR